MIIKVKYQKDFLRKPINASFSCDSEKQIIKHLEMSGIYPEHIHELFIQKNHRSGYFEITPAEIIDLYSRHSEAGLIQ